MSRRIARCRIAPQNLRALVEVDRLVEQVRGLRRVRGEHRRLDQVRQHVELLVVGDPRVARRLAREEVVGHKVRGEDDVRADGEDGKVRARRDDVDLEEGVRQRFPLLSSGTLRNIEALR